MRQNLVKIHAIAATLALVLIIMFFTGTIVSETFGNQQTVSTIKTMIFMVFGLLFH